MNRAQSTIKRTIINPRGETFYALLLSLSHGATANWNRYKFQAGCDFLVDGVLKNLFWFSLLFMAQQFALTYPDSAKLLPVLAFKHMLKPVCCENVALLLCQKPHEE